MQVLETSLSYHEERIKQVEDSIASRLLELNDLKELVRKHEEQKESVEGAIKVLKDANYNG